MQHLKLPLSIKMTPWLVYFPNPSMAMVKIFDHMMELKIPTPIRAHIARLPDENIAKATKNTHIVANKPNVLPEILFPIINAIKLSPIIKT